MTRNEIRLINALKAIIEAVKPDATGDALVEVARSRNENAKELASYHNFDDEPFDVMSTIDPNYSDTFK